MTPFDDLDRALGAYLDQAAAAPAPAFLLVDALDTTSRRRPRPRWQAEIMATRHAGVDDGRLTLMAIGVATALLTLLLAGLIAGGARPPSPLVVAPPQPTPSLAAATPGDPGVTPYPVLPGEPWIAYMNNVASADTDRLFLVRPDGGDRHQLVTGLDGQQEHPDWSPDGSKLAFDHWFTDPALPDQSRIDIWTVNADGTGASKVAACDLPCLQVSYPSWSPDGTHIAYIRSDRQAAGRWGPSAIEIVDVGTGTKRTVLTTPDGSAAYYEVGWSPDGTQLVFGLETYTDATETTQLSARVAIVRADGSEGSTPRLVTPEGLIAAEPDWHPSGDRIVFRTRFDPADPGPTSETTDIEVVNIDGSGLVNLTSPGLPNLRSIEPAWTPDGKAIVFTQVDGFGAGQLPAIARMNADGSNVTRLGFATGTVPRMRPTP